MEMSFYRLCLLRAYMMPVAGAAAILGTSQVFSRCRCQALMVVPTTYQPDHGGWWRTGGRGRRRQESQRAARPALDIGPRTWAALGNDRIIPPAA
mmetsp:Transcript_17624/g.28666  ORF Transcript_17624/g.28666 Transcript_17624/m.28666 type:complete len:95 (-) Transcript_17624:552-836(-)